MKIHLLLLCIVAMFVVECIPPDAQETEDKIASENEALIRQVYELMNQRQLDAVFELYAEDYIYHGPGGFESRGRDGIRGLWEIWLKAFPDLTSTVDDVISQGDKLAVRWTVEGTHKGEFLGIPASNKKIILPITEIFRIADGQLVEAWDQFDQLHLMQQIGANPESAPNEALTSKEAIDKARKAINAAWLSGDADVIMPYFADDVISMIPNVGRITGKEETRNFLNGFFDRYTMTDLKVTEREVLVSGDFAIETILYDWEIVPKDGSEGISEQVKFVGIWQRQSDGAWRQVRGKSSSAKPNAAGK